MPIAKVDGQIFTVCTSNNVDSPKVNGVVCYTGTFNVS